MVSYPLTLFILSFLEVVKVFFRLIQNRYPILNILPDIETCVATEIAATIPATLRGKTLLRGTDDTGLGPAPRNESITDPAFCFSI